MSRKKKIILGIMIVLLVASITVLAAGIAYAAPEDGAATTEEGSPGNVLDALLSGDNATTIQIIALLTILSLAPSILIMLTGFTRIIIILSFIRNAIGMQQMPPNQVMVGLALFITFLVMAPTWDRINEEAYKPYISGQIEASEALETVMDPIRDFMLKQTYKSDLEFFIDQAKLEEELQDVADVPTHVLIPAFIISEIKQAFQIGFFIYIPFIVVDMVVASVLMSMGMMMLPPTVISLPFKVLLFIIVDGWRLTIGAIIGSFQT